MDRDRFLSTIYARPLDVGPRLVYADYLEESGDPFAEFIRLCISFRPCSGLSLQPIIDGMGRKSRVCAHFCDDKCTPIAARERRLELFLDHEEEWFRPQLQHYNPRLEAGDELGYSISGNDVPACRLIVHRGFLDKVRTSSSAWFGRPCRHCGGAGKRPVVEVHGKLGGKLDSTLLNVKCLHCHGRGCHDSLGVTLCGVLPICDVEFADWNVESMIRPDFWRQEIAQAIVAKIREGRYLEAAIGECAVEWARARHVATVSESCSAGP